MKNWLYAVAVMGCLAVAVARAAPADPSPSQEFAQTFQEWKEKLGAPRGLQQRYQVASEVEKFELESEYQALLAHAKKLMPELLAAAQQAYRDAPNKDAATSDFLYTFVAQSVHMDDYEPAAETARMLADNKQYPQKSILNLAGIIMFATGRFDLAKQYFDAAAKAGTLDDLGKKLAASVDEYEKLWTQEQKIRAIEAKANDLPRVLLKTSKGKVVVELFENEAPNTTANFIRLVESGFYNRTLFHRVLRNFMAQGGDPKGDGSGGPGYTIACECDEPNHRNHFRGSLSMAHAGPDTGGSQFFLTFLPTPHLNGKHTVFGRVIEGLDVLAKLKRVEPGQSGDAIIQAEVLRKRPHPYRVKKHTP